MDAQAKLQPRPIRVLLIEDNAADARLLAESLADIPSPQFQLDCRFSLAEAVAAHPPDYDVVMVDLSLPDSSGIGTVFEVRRRFPELPVIVLTGMLDENLAIAALQQGAQDYLVKSRSDGDLISRSIRYAIERWRSDRSLHARERELQVLLEQTPAVLWSTDASLSVVSVSGGPLRALGFDAQELIGRELAAFPGMDHRAIAAHRRALQGDSGGFELEVQGRYLQCHVEPLPPESFTGEVRSSEEQPKPRGVIGVGLDLTERKNLEVQLRQSQKMEAIGRLAGGIAHDFNNLLTVISSYCEALLNSGAELPSVRDNASEIWDAAHRASTLTGQLLTFSRHRPAQLGVISLNEVIRGMESMLRRLIGEDVEIIIRTGSALGNIMAETTQMEQVMLNLVVNARDAMPEGGRLVIETANVELDEAYSDRHGAIEAGSYAVLSVSDTGIGMDAETRAHIFEPFFTTKSYGTGLGLATVYGIIRQAGGFIWVYSEPDDGTTFKIYLPRVTGAVAAESRAEEEKEQPVTGDETILLVDDDDAVRRLVKRALEGRGYTVHACEGPLEAIQCARDINGPVHLLLTDVVMPGMSGRQLADEVARIRPGIQVLYMSGYTDDATTRYRIAHDGINYLQKPFTPAILARRIRQVLARKVEAASRPAN
jgi:two-component system cell cycle sensor histidine kinase/response regulator CckA